MKMCSASICLSCPLDLSHWEMVMASRVLFSSCVALSPLLGSLGFLNKIRSVSVDCPDKRSQVLICWLSCPFPAGAPVCLCWTIPFSFYFALRQSDTFQVGQGRPYPLSFLPLPPRLAPPRLTLALSTCSVSSQGSQHLFPVSSRVNGCKPLGISFEK